MLNVRGIEYTITSNLSIEDVIRYRVEDLTVVVNLSNVDNSNPNPKVNLTRPLRPNSPNLVKGSSHPTQSDHSARESCLIDVADGSLAIQTVSQCRREYDCQSARPNLPHPSHHTNHWRRSSTHVYNSSSVMHPS